MVQALRNPLAQMMFHVSARRTIITILAMLPLLLEGAEPVEVSSGFMSMQASKSEAPGNGLQGGRRPNIVFMMVDNFGYGDLGSYGGGVLRGVPTPRLDKLAAEGLRLTNFNVEPECTPSRSALMTGRMPIRSATSEVQKYEIGRPDGLSPWEYTIAELLSDAGYNTALYGKWHLGTSPGRLPTDQGFDEWYGIPRSSVESTWMMQPGYDGDVTMAEYIMEGRKGGNTSSIQVYDLEARSLVDQTITDLAASYIRAHANSDKPFFLYVPFTLPHSPPLTAPEFRKPSRSQYQNALAEIDYNAGKVIDAVDAAGIENNTLVVFTSDNGPETLQGIGINYGGQSDSGPFRGEFPSGWEGAIRVPCILRWPGHTEPGRVSNDVVSILDFYRTCASMAGAVERIPTDRAMDSVSQVDFLFGDLERSEREFVMFFHAGELLSIKWRNFKVHTLMRDIARGPVVAAGQSVVTGVKTTPNVQYIFDIENDPKELWNIAPTNGWVGMPFGKILGLYEQSVAKFPNLEPGSETPGVPPAMTCSLTGLPPNCGYNVAF
jgi:arylsulfatase